MSNFMKVPHTVVFEALINLDTVPPSLLPQLMKLSESEITEMCKGATLHAINANNLLDFANAGNSWAEITVKE